MIKKEQNNKIIDAHVHLPCLNSNLKSFKDKKKQLFNDMATAKIDYAIVIADSEISSQIGSIEDCVKLFKYNSNIFVIAGISPIIAYEDRLLLVEKLLKRNKIVGIKLFAGHEEYFLNDLRLEKVFALCEKYNVPLVLHTGWDNSHLTHPKYIRDIAINHANLKVIISHLCYPELDMCYNLTADLSNVYYDISSLAFEKDNAPMVKNILTLIAKDNPQKLLYGSDYSECNMLDHIELVKSLDIPEQTKRQLLFDNAVRVYRLKIKP